MSDSNEGKSGDGSKSWGAKFPKQLAKRVNDAMEIGGYFNISEFIRSACREKVAVIENRQYKRIMDYFITEGKIRVTDLASAIQHLSGYKIPE